MQDRAVDMTVTIDYRSKNKTDVHIRISSFVSSVFFCSLARTDIRFAINEGK